MGYDPTHPVGTKYTEKELRSHRDRWFAKVAAGEGRKQVGDTLPADRAVFGRLRPLLSAEFLAWFSDFDFGNAFRRVSIEPLEILAAACKDLENEFLDADLESCRAQVSTAVDEFMHEMARLTITDKTNSEWRKIPRAWHGDFDHRTTLNEAELYEQFRAEERTLNSAADAVNEKWRLFIRTSKYKLAVE